MTKLDRIAAKILPGETVYDSVSRIGAGCCGYMPASVLRDSRPATPRLLLAAAAKLVGYPGAVVRERITGEEPGSDAATAASVAAVLRHAR